MQQQSFTTGILVDQSPTNVFHAIQNVRGWWSEEIKGNSASVNDEFVYEYMEVHRCRIRIADVVPDRKIVWHVLENNFSFTEDKTEWIGTNAIFEISAVGDQTRLQFTHDGLVPEYECYNACVNGWTQYITQSLMQLITTGKGLPNTRTTTRTIHEVALRFMSLANQNKWFEIQDELFAEEVKSIEPEHAIHLQSTEGKTAVRKKGEAWVSRVEQVHSAYTGEPIISAKHFAVTRDTDMTVQGIGRVNYNQIMMYQVEDGKIVEERFFY